MKVFRDQLNLTMHFEGFCAKAYKCPAGVWTIGYGSTQVKNKPITEGMVCTMIEAQKWLQTGLDQAKTQLKSRGVITASQSELDALADYAYNCGINAFPTLLSKIKTGDKAGAALEILDGIYMAKKPLLGLLLRRIAEYNTFTTATYCAFDKNDPISQDLKDKLLAKNARNQDAVNMINQLGVK